MKLFYKNIVFIFCVLLSPFLQGQDVVEVGEYVALHSLTDCLTVYKDYERGTSFSEILKKDSAGLFKKTNSKALIFGPDTAVYWVKVEIHNIGEENNMLLLEIPNPHINVSRLFIKRENRIDIGIACGDEFPFHQRVLNYRNCVFKIPIQHDEVVTIYFYADNFGSFMEIPMKLWEENIFMEKIAREEIVLGGVFGVCIIALFIVLCLFIIKPSKTHVCFLIYTMANVFYLFAQKGVGYQYFWPGSPMFNTMSRPLFAIIGIAASLQLIRTYFKTKNDYISIDKWIRFVLINVILSAVILFVHLFKPSPISLIGVKYTRIVTLMYPLVSIASCLYIYHKNKDKKSLLFLCVFVSTMVGGGVIVLGQMEILQNHFIFENILLFTFLIDFCILLVLLSFDGVSTKNQNLKLSNELLTSKVKGLESLLLGQQQERQRLSQSLHDGASLRLANVQMLLSSFQHEIREEGQWMKLNSILKKLERTAKEIRSFSHALNPAVLDKYGLVFALEDLVEGLEDTNPEISFLFSYNYLKEENLPANIEQSLYFMVLELVMNGIKYAKATNIVINLRKHPNEVFLLVKDDGIGYNEKLITKGIGLRNIQARTDLLNGVFLVKSIKYVGTENRIVIPL